MKTILILLALGYVGSEKLNLGYLPPPGSKYAGGRPGDIETPLEFPKETYSTTLRPLTGDNRGLSPEDYKATIGIERVPGVQNVDIGSPGPGSLSQNAQKVPTTTVSYAFTQTTTHPPTEGFETTIGPQITGEYPTTDAFNTFPSQGQGGNLTPQNVPGYQQIVNVGQRPTQPPTSGPVFNNIPSQEPGLAYQGQLNQFGQPILTPTSGPISKFPGSPVPSLAPIEQQFIGQMRPGQQQVLNQVQPGYQQSGIGNLPGVSPTSFEQIQFRNQSFPGDLRNENQPGFIPSTVAPQGYPSTIQSTGTTNGDRRIIPSFVPNVPQTYPGQQGQVNEYLPGTNAQNIQNSGQQQFFDGLAGNQQFPGPQVATQFGGTRQPSSTAAPNYSPNQQTFGTTVAPNSEYSNTQYNNQGNIPGLEQYPQLQGSLVRQNAFQPSSTASPSFVSGAPTQGYPTDSSILPGQPDQQFPSSVVPGTYPTPGYPSVQANAESSVSRLRPERPQAEADRNAVIISYENTITPEGYAYSYDTSNGIHADENGTTIDGTKAEGSYSYIGDDGKLYSVVYTADEDGFRPVGDHLPTPPPVPEAIQRVIDQAEKDREAGISDDGFYNEDKYGHKKYQGSVGRRPQLSDKTNGFDVPEDKDTKTQQLKQRLRPQTSQRRPIGSTVESDRDEEDVEPELMEDQRATNVGNRRRPGQVSTQRPLNYATRINEEDSIGGDLEGIIDDSQSFGQRPANQPSIDVSSKRPIISSDRKPYNKIPGFKESTIRNGVQRRPINRIPSKQNIKNDESFGLNKPEDTKKNRLVNKGSLGRPEESQEDIEYEDGETTAPDNYDDETSSTRPSIPGYSRQPGSNIQTGNEQDVEKQTYDKYGRPVPATRPSAGKNRFETKPTIGESYIKQSGSKKQSPKPSTYSPVESQTSTDDYISEENHVTKSPTRLHLGGVNNTNKNVFKHRIVPGTVIGKRRRPGTSGFNVNEPSITDEHIQYQPEDGEEYFESNVDDDVYSQDYDNRRVTLSEGIPSQTYDERYEEIEQESDDNVYSQADGSDRPRVTSSSKYGGTRGRPQTPKTNMNENRSQTSGNNRSNVSRPGSKFGQDRPTFDQQTNQITSKDYIDRPFNSSGYQYIPPQKKFEQDEVIRLPTRVSGTTRRPFTGRPTTSTVYYEDEEVTGSTRPFMTPNVSQTDREYIGNGEQEFIPGQTVGPNYQRKQQNQFDDKDYSQNTEDGTTPDQVYGDDDISSTGPVTKYSSSTARPIHHQTTGRPQYYDQKTINGPGFKEQVTEKGRPTQGPDNRYYEESKKPYGVSSTTPLPSTRPHVSSKRPTRPGQQGQVFREGNYKIVPGQTFVTSTTALPSQSPDSLYRKDTVRPQYQTTYRPLETVRPTGVSVNQYQENLPSTTYRPNYKITGQPSSTVRPGVQVDRYGRPVVRPGYGSTSEEYTPGQYQPTSTVRPGSSIDVYGRPVRPGYSTPAQEFLPGDQNVPSSTTAPGVLVDTFGRPIRPGSGISAEEFVPGQAGTSTAKPGVYVDAFGRPINNPTGTLNKYLPDGHVLPSSTATPGSLVDAYGRPTTAGFTPQDNSLGFTTPSGNVGQRLMGDQVIRQYQPGVSPSEQQFYPGSVDYQGHPTTVTISPGTQFRGNQKYTLGFNQPGLNQGVVSSTFQPSTERIIGEDFSGPKQQQKFDPERGYYYK